MHKSRLGVLVIDCRTDDLTEAAHFWSQALGYGLGKLDADGKYWALESPADQIKVLLQKVEHEPRVHLDIETDDRAAEVERLKALGATSVGEVKRWHVLQAPSGHRFCVVNPQRGDLEERGNPWPPMLT